MKKLLSLILVAIMLVTAMPMAFAEGNTYKVGDIIQFGSYPQSEVKDEALIAELNALAPEWGEWTSYGYYSGDGNLGSMVQGDWMRYTDITYNGNKYRGVKFTQYRPGDTYYRYNQSNINQVDNGYSTNAIYWFKFEPIDWRVLDPATGLVMCEIIIDSQPYSNTIYINNSVGDYAFGIFNDASYTNYASDYETSSIRKWLNNDFFDTAFMNGEKKEINTTTLNNDGYYTSIGVTGYEKLDSNSTNDKIFLLSYDETINSNFGFSSDDLDSDKARQAQGSDYAKSQGLFVETSTSCSGNSSWLLRSPGAHSLESCNGCPDGTSFHRWFVSSCCGGVRPALRVNLSSEIVNPGHTCSYNSVITHPTCTAEGYTTFSCRCGDTYKANYVDKLNHKDDNTDYKCDFGCGYEFEKPVPDTSEEPEEELNFFQKIIQWFKDLFDKLFGWLK